MILLWDSSEPASRCVVISEGTEHTYEWEAHRTLARDMLAYLRDTLARHDATLADITGIGVYRGPGSFTGLRIGMTVLNTLADATKVPIVGTSGENWQHDALERLRSGENDSIVLPLYGAEARITQPRK